MVKETCCGFDGCVRIFLSKMTSWRDVLLQRQIAIDAADREELEAKKKYVSPSEENNDTDNSYSDVNRRSKFASFSTAAAATYLLGTDVTDVQLPASDNLQDRYECNMSAMQEKTTTYSSGVENSSIDNKEAATANFDVTEFFHQSSPTSGDLTDRLKFDADGESVHSVDCIESDHICSSVIDSSLSHHQPSESLSSTPEHQVSAKVSRTGNLCTSDDLETRFADEMSQPFAEGASSVDSALDMQSPDHKRTRKHAHKHGTRAKKKHSRAVGEVETVPADEVTTAQQEIGADYNDHCSKALDIQPTSLSEQLELDTFQSQPSDKTQHFDVVPDVTVYRHASYLRAVNIGNESTVTSQKQSDSTDVAVATVAEASKDHLSSVTTGSK